MTLGTPKVLSPWGTEKNLAQNPNFHLGLKFDQSFFHSDFLKITHLISMCLFGSVSLTESPIFEFIDLLILTGRSGTGDEAERSGTDLESIFSPKFEGDEYSSLKEQ